MLIPTGARVLGMAQTRYKPILVMIALLAWPHQSARGAPVHDSECVPRFSNRRVAYCESIAVGGIALTATNFSSTLIVSLVSDAFIGLERAQTPNGWEFRKGKQRISTYPPEFTLAIEATKPPVPTSSMPAPMPERGIRLPAELQPRRAIVRWLDRSQQVINEKVSDLQELVEAWPELRPPLVWYQGKIAGVKEPLAATIEVQVIGDAGVLLGTMRGHL
jgi:hypothetical protein